MRPIAVADPLPDAVRAILEHPARPAHARAAADRVQLLAHHGSRMETPKTKPSRSSGASIPKGRAQLVLAERTEDPARTHILKRGDFLQPDRAVTPGRAVVSQSAARRRAAQSPDVRPMAGRPQVAHHRALHRQSRLAGLLRHRHRGHGRESRHAGRAAFQPATARLAGGRVHGFRLEPEEAATPHRHFRGLPPVVERYARAARQRSR